MGKANALKGAIERECGAKAELKHNTSTIYISEIKAGISEKEVEEIIRSNTTKEKGKIQINLRENRYGNQNATVTLERKIARHILKWGT